MRKDEVGVAVPQILGSDFYAVSVVNKGTGEDISGICTPGVEQKL